MHPYFELATPHLFAHQGASGEAPSNTMAAFERAVKDGIPFLETDCHPTRDGEIVLCHDATVDRTTNGEGEIRELAMRQLDELDAGYRFSADGSSFPFRDQGIRIPRLRELLEALPGVRINLEIKQGDQAVVDEVYSLVARAGATDRVLLAAAEEDVMERIHAASPSTAIGSSTTDVLRFYEAVRDETWQKLELRGHALQIPQEFAGLSLVTEQALHAAHQLGLFVHVWTVNERADMQALLEADVDGIMSDYPATLIQQAQLHAGVR